MIHNPNVRPREALLFAMPAVKKSRNMVSRIIVEAMAELGPATHTEIVIAAWQKNRRVLGLKGAFGYPDSNKVSAALYGKRGLIAKGHVLRHGKTKFKLARAS